MIDHISIGVRDLAQATRFYENVLEVIGYRVMEQAPGTVAFGKNYPEFWLNHRPDRSVDDDSGMHICLRTRSADSVDAFHAAALAHGGTSDGSPGFRPEYHESYYAAFVRDADGNKIEVVNFVAP